MSAAMGIELGWQAWVFVALALSLGMAHGAMDVLLLLRERQAMQQMAWYGAAVLLIAVAMAGIPAIALLVLLLMSVWHFGEQVFSTQSKMYQKLCFRLSLGGASVMWPVLLQGAQMQALLQGLFPQDAAWLWPAWQGLSWLWLALCVLTLVVALLRRRPWRWSVEVGVLAVVYLALPPLLAFSVYFGLYHSVAHILRMRRLSAGSQTSAWWAVLALTWLAMAGLAWAMGLQTSWQALQVDTAAVLRWLIVALTAVTLPHLILVGRAQTLLYRR
jgi:beta-carotene 15,15'-dioxygenase